MDDFNAMYARVKTEVNCQIKSRPAFEIVKSSMSYYT